MRTLNDYHNQVALIKKAIQDNQKLTSEMHLFIHKNGLYPAEDMVFPDDETLIKLLKNRNFSSQPYVLWAMWDILQKPETSPEVFKAWRNFLIEKPTWNDLTQEELNDPQHLVYQHITKEEIRKLWHTPSSFFPALFSAEMIQKNLASEHIQLMGTIIANNETIYWELLEKHLTKPKGNTISLNNLFMENSMLFTIMMREEKSYERWMSLFEESWTLMKKHPRRDKFIPFLCQFGFQFNYPASLDDEVLSYCSKNKSAQIRHVKKRINRWIKLPNFAEYIHGCSIEKDVLNALFLVDTNLELSEKTAKFLATHIIYGRYKNLEDQFTCKHFNKAISSARTFYEMGVPLNNVIESVFNDTLTNTTEIHIIV